MSCPDHGELCLSKISKCLSAWQLVFLHNSSRCSFFSRHSSHLWPRSSGRVLPSGSRTWLYAIKSACSTGLQESCFRQLDLAPFDLLFWPHPLVIHHSAPGRSEALRRP